MRTLIRDLGDFIVEQLWEPINRTALIFCITIGVEVFNHTLWYYSQNPPDQPKVIVSSDVVFQIVDFFGVASLILTGGTLLIRLVVYFWNALKSNS